jgi:hypothetical protein
MFIAGNTELSANLKLIKKNEYLFLKNNLLLYLHENLQ